MAVDLAADFTQFTLTGASVNNPTSLQFGPDGRLYVSQQDGLLKIFTIQKNASGYQVTATETITLIKSIPNHNDNGSLNTTQTSRQVTGLLVTGTAAEPVIYVGSSDPRIAVGSDSNLDTNSGIISRLTLLGNGQWDKVDLVRGLPRSEENHSVNGLQYNEATNELYVAVGGNTNMGAPSNSFGWLPEYAYAAAILKVDLDAIDAMTVKNDSSSGTNHKYIYDLPTLNDPTRGSNETVFGGNDGLNMAKITAGSPVQIYSPGFRNAYDVLVAESGKMYVIDNGPNSGWGGIPVIGPDGVTNEGVNGGSSLSDTLHLVTPGYYGGHPNPIRANGSAAGLTDSDGTADGLADGELLPANQLPSDFDTVVATTNPKEANYEHPGGDNPALWTNGQSTNGLAEYTASNFSNQLKGDLFTVGYGGFVYRLDLNSAGTAVQGVSTLNVGGTPLDVIAQGDDKPFAGSIWITKYGADSILILEPEPPATPPPGDDDDGDGLSNTIDRFPLDANNGMATLIEAGETLTWSLSPADPDTPGPSNSLFALGLTGLMADLHTPYAGLYDIENLTPGGAGGVVTIDAVSAGTAQGNLNTQREAFHFGVTPAAGTDEFTITSNMDNPFDTIASPANDQSQGMYFGTGDQDNYLRISAHANGGAGGFEVLLENNGVVTKQMYAASGLISAADANDGISLSFDVDVAAGTATPKWTYTTNNRAQIVQDDSAPVTLSGSLLSALRGSYTVDAEASGLAVGLIATSAGQGSPFTASWDNFQISAPPIGGTSPGAASMKINAGATIDASTYNTNSFSVTNTGQKNIVSIAFDTRTNALPGIVFDPQGTAGDTAAKNLQIDQFGSTGAIEPAANDFSAFSVPSNGGYNVMTVSFNQAVNSGFNPGETVTFSVDIDPYDIKNSGINGDAGSVSGLELTGSKVTVTFADGTTQVTEIIGDGSQGGAEAEWRTGIPAAPTLTLAGRSSGEVGVTSASQTVSVTGAPNGTVTVMIMTGGSGNNVVPVDAFDANKAIAVEYRQVALNSSGQGSFNITVPPSDPLFISAAIDGGAAGPGRVSPALIVAIDDTAPPTDTTPPTATGGAGNLTAAAASHTATITWSDAGSGVDASTIGTNDITVTGGPSPVTVSSVSTSAGTGGSIIATYTLTSAGGFDASDNGTYTISRVAGAVEDLANNGITAGTQDTFTVNIGSTPPPTGTIAINNGGSAYTDADTGIAYAADTGQYANGGSKFTSSQAITGTNDDALYNTQRYSTGNLIYNVPVTDGDYVVTLKFAEIYSGITGVGQRVFDVRAEGQLVLDNLDVYQRVGAYTAFDWSGTINVTDGNLTLEFLKGAAQNPFISAISIQPAGSTPPPTDTTPPSGTGGANNLTTAAASHTATITWSDSGSGVDAATIGTNDITVTGGPSAVTVSSVSTSAGAGGSIIATYTLTSTGGFDASDNGTYTISRVAGAVEDLANNGIIAGTQDSFTVNIGGSGGTITGTSGNDTLTGTTGNDTIDGLGGNDTIDGLAGADTMRGGTGNDNYYVENAGDEVVELAGQGTDLVNAYISYTLGDNVENLFLRASALINGTGNALNNRMEGNDSANDFFGLGGNDILIGRGGLDELTGGAGNDLFDYNLVSDSRGTSIDRILDFVKGQDKIDLSTIDANSALSGNQAFAFIGTAAFSGTAGQLRYSSAGGTTSVFADTNGDKSADMTIQLVGTITLAGADFIL